MLKHRSAQAEYLRHLRAIAKNEGKCGTCRARPAREGLKSCLHCCMRTSQQKVKMRAEGRCECGGERAVGRKRCLGCLMRSSDRQARRVNGAKEAGLCVTCVTAPPKTGRVMCSPCLRTHADRQAEYRSRR